MLKPENERGKACTSKTNRWKIKTSYSVTLETGTGEAELETATAKKVGMQDMEEINTGMVKNGPSRTVETELVRQILNLVQQKPYL